MERKSIDSVLYVSQWLIFITINLLFLFKYVPRIGVSPRCVSTVYVLGIAVAAWVWLKMIMPRLTDKAAKICSFSILVALTLIISLVLYKVEPLSINVDRWSATTYFLDALFDGVYPYGVHTHVSETNYPSPFPLWHYLNLPFWLCGDVGIGLILFLWLTAGAVFYYYRDFKTVLSFLLLLVSSPSYWWEIMTRSDGLSNALLVFAVILLLEMGWFSDKNDLTDKWWLIALIAGCIACTRLSAVIPMAIYLFGRYVRSDLKTLILFPLIVLAVIFIFFAPYIFWDTESWIFFSRNPILTQSSPGNGYILGILIIIAIILSVLPMTFHRRISTIGIFMFTFMLASQLGVIYMAEENITLFDIQCDISYFTLSLPYCLSAIVGHKS